MKKTIENIIVLYDTHNQGKTSTLRALIKELVGSLPNDNGDIRVVIPNYRVKSQRKRFNIFVTTCGDNPFVIDDNIRFFNGKMPDSQSVPTFIFNNGSWKAIESQDEFADHAANICISACRTDGAGVDELQCFTHTHLSYTFVSMWIRLKHLRNKLNMPRTKKEPDWGLLAQELKNLVDKIIITVR
ncbi:MAG: hypothetical protein PUE90_05785 [Bacteroidales bacterium]|nr:hypothetical protein [Bacteroidales bacterium]